MNWTIFLLMSSIIWMPALCTILFNIVFSLIPAPKWFLYYLAPGVILHELSHALATILMGQTITDFHPFQLPSPDGTMGYVTHAYNPVSLKDQLIGNGLISLAPAYVLGGIVVSLFYGSIHHNMICLNLLLIFGLSLLNGMRLSSADWHGAKWSILFWFILSYIVSKCLYI